MSLTSETILSEIETPEAISWGAIFGGAVAAIGLTVILAFVGTGMGLSAVSPWRASGVGLTTFAVSSAIWLVVMQWLSSAMAGYLAGRLRTRGTSLGSEEAYFRDTAHGFMAWAVSTLIVVALFGSSLGGLVSGAASTASTIVGGAASGATQAAGSQAAQVPTGYFVDMLFRPGQGTGTAAAPTTPGAPGATDSFAAMRSEAMQIVTTDLASGTWSQGDKAELAHVIAVHTGLSDADAQHRVDDVIAQIDAAKLKLQQAADTARKAGLTFAFMTALSLAIGAFIASAAGALGGHRREML